MNSDEAKVGAFLQRLAERLDAHGGNGLDGPIQLNVTGAAEARHWFIGGDAPPGARAKIRLTSGQHPDPKWSISCSLETMVRIAEQRFVIDDPSSLGALEISGDALTLFDKLGPFLESWPDHFGRREEVARAANASALVEVRRFDTLTVEAIEWAAEHLVPVVFKKGLPELPAWKWGVPGLLERCGGIPHLDFVNFRETTLSQYLQDLINNPTNKHGAGGLRLHEELARDVSGFDLYPLRVEEPMIWCSGAGSVTTLHRDLTDVLNMQVIGRKKWTLYSPDQAERVYVLPPQQGYQQATVNVRSPDFERFPRYREARACEVTLGPGEIIFNPGGWFHEVAALDLALSLAFRVSYNSRLPAKRLD